MHRTTRLKVTDINPHFICVLCDGYLVDATTIVECLHSFCRTCIVQYLENSKFCPVCDVQVHKTKPLQSIKSDTTLQDIVYKLVPGLYQNEMQRRREFYSEHPKEAAKCSTEERGEGAEQRCFYSPSENISLSLEYFQGGASNGTTESDSTTDTNSKKDVMTRYLNCPAAVTVAHLKKFIRMKFSLSQAYAIEILYGDQLLRDDDSLIDIAYMYSWRRAGPMQFAYTFTRERITPKTHCPPPVSKEIVDVPEEKIPENAENTTSSVSSVEAPSEEPAKMEVDDTSDSSSAKDSASSSSCSSNEQVELEDTSSSVPEQTPASEPQRMEEVEVEMVEVEVDPSPVEEEPAADANPPTVKIAAPPPQNPSQPPSNGIKLKFISCPSSADQKGKKMVGRRMGRPRYKSAPVNKYHRLAPYPSPHPSATPPCVAQITMGKLMPSVMTALVTSPANTALCNVSKSTLPPVAFLGPSQGHVVTCNVTTQQITCNATVNSSFAPVSNCNIVSSNIHPVVSASPNLASTTHVISIPASPSVNMISSVSPCPVLAKPAVPEVCPPAVTTPVSEASDQKSNPIPECNGTGESNSPTHVESVSCDKSSVGKISSEAGTNGGAVTGNSSASAELPPSSPSLLKTALLSRPSTPVSTMNETNGPMPKPASDFKLESKSSTEDFEMRVKNSISAEFSDNDDLGCQADLVVDEQKMDSSDNEDDTDAALRKKITAIAEKDDDADGTDDTEADSGRASELSSQARSSCDDDVGSPMNIAASVPESTTSSSSRLTTFSVSTTTATTNSSSRTMKSNNINHVINNLLKNHEKKDTTGALDLSTCTKKPGEVARSRPVANPVLDIKHRQQTYLPAPSNNKQHTACTPSPKSPILMHSLTNYSNHVPSPVLPVPLTGGLRSKSPHLPVPAFQTNLPIPYTVPIRGMSSPNSLSGRSPPMYPSSPPLPMTAAMMGGLLPCRPNSMNNFPLRGTTPIRNSSPCNHLKGIATPPQNPYAKMASHHKPVGNGRKSVDSLKAKSPSTPASRALISPNFTPGTQATYPKPSPMANMRLSPHHRSASPAPSPKPAPATVTSPVPPMSRKSFPSSSGSKKSSNSYKSYNYKFKGSNLAVVNPDPNGYQHKIVIRKMD